MIREKHHRLPLEAYRGFVHVSLTTCIRNRDSFFTTHDRFTLFEKMLVNALEKFRCGADVYLFMPDHVHLVLRGESEGADIWRAMWSFKQKTGFWLSQNHPSVRWQKDFYDHILRNDVAVERHIRYVLHNPERDGFVDDWRDYPFKGSTVHDFDEWD
jgi:putative transposase